MNELGGPMLTRVQEALSAPGGDVNKRDRDGSALLHLACKVGDMAAVDALLSGGANLVNADRRNRHPLHCAAEAGATAVAARLIEELVACKRAALMLQAVDETGLTPLHLAARTQRGDASPALLRLLLPRLPDGLLAGPLFGAAAAADGPPSVMACSALRGNVEAIELLAAAGAAADAPERRFGGRRALALAAAEGHADAVRALCALGADVNARDDDGATAAHWACDMGHAQVARWLTAPAPGGAGADASAVDAAGRSVQALLEEAGEAEAVEDGAGAGAAAAVAARPAPYYNYTCYTAARTCAKYMYDIPLLAARDRHGGGQANGTLSFNEGMICHRHRCRCCCCLPCLSACVLLVAHTPARALEPLPAGGGGAPDRWVAFVAKGAACRHGASGRAANAQLRAAILDPAQGVLRGAAT
eukprot:g7844.t1